MIPRVEVWGNLQCAGGSRLAAVPDVASAADTRRLGGDDQLEVTLPVTSPAWGDVKAQRVVRVVYADATFDEWRITDVAKSEAMRPGRLGSLSAGPVLLDLRSSIVMRTEADGTVVHDFEALQLTPTEHLTTFVLASLAADGFGYFALGTIEATVPVDVVYAWDSALAICRRLAESTGTELRVRRNGTTQYLIDLLIQTNGSSPKVDVRFAKNLRGVKHQVSSHEQATRVYPRGVEIDGIRATMSRARWKITAIAGNVVTLVDSAGGDGPAQFADQLDNLYLRTPGGTLHLVNDSVVVSATQTNVTLAAVTGLAVNDLIEFRKNAAGDRLTYLEAPAQKALYGLLSDTVDRPDLAETVNLVVNPAMRTWTGLASDPPNSWTKVGTPTLTKTSTATRWRTGGQSCRVQSTADGQGLETNYVTVTPTEHEPEFSGFVGFWIESGRVRVELWATDGVTTWRHPDGTDGLAYSTLQQVWDDLGATNFGLKKLNATQVKIRIVQDGAGTADFYVDAAQICQNTGQGQEPFVEGSGGTALWQAANEELRRRADPSVRLDVDVVDLARHHPGIWPDDALVIGGPIGVRHAALGLAIDTRVLEIARDLTVAADTRVVLSNRPEDLTDALVRPRRAPRKVLTPSVDTDLTVQAAFSDVAQSPATVNVRLGARPASAQLFYILQDAGDAVPVVGAASWSTYTTSFNVARNPTLDKQLSAYARVGGRYSRVETWIIAKASQPHVTLQLSEQPAGTLVINWTPNGDVVEVAVYRKKNGTTPGWPTTNNNVDGPLDMASFIGRFSPTPDGGGWDANGNPTAGKVQHTEAGYVNGDTAKVILVPIDKYGIPGPRASESKAMTGASNAALTSFSAAKTSDGSSCSTGFRAQVAVSWTVNAGVAAGTHDLRIYRSTNGAPRILLATISTPASLLSYSPDFVEDYVAGGPLYTWTYSYELIDQNTLAILDSGSTQVSFNVSGTCPV